jgi:hypothetical protein
VGSGSVSRGLAKGDGVRKGEKVVGVAEVASPFKGGTVE